MRISKCLLIMALLFPVAASAQPGPKPGPKPGTQVNVRGCPGYMDFGSCPFVIKNGYSYSLFGGTNPQPGLGVAVRGTVTNQIGFCSGIILDPIKVTITRQKCQFAKSRRPGNT